MLNLNFSVSVKEGCKSLILKDITDEPPAAVSGRYGGTNIAKSAITKTVLIIRVPSGAEYTIYSTFLPTQPEWQIDADMISDLQKSASYTPCPDVEEDCGCAPIPQAFISVLPFHFPGDRLKYNNSDCGKPNTLNYFEDGCTEITYEVYGKTHIPVKTCKYGMAHKLCAGQTVWGKRNGGWYNITSLGTNTNGNFVFNTASTIEVYSDWEIREAGGVKVLVKGIFTKYDCTDSGETTTSAIDTLIASKTIRFPFTCNVEKLIENIAAKLTVEGNCDALKAGASEYQAISLFALSRAKILSIKNSAAGGELMCDCDCVMSGINSAVSMLTQVIKLDKLDIDVCG